MCQLIVVKKNYPSCSVSTLYHTQLLIMIQANRQILLLCAGDYMGKMSPQHAPVFVLPFAKPCGI